MQKFDIEPAGFLSLANENAPVIADRSWSLYWPGGEGAIIADTRASMVGGGYSVPDGATTVKLTWQGNYDVFSGSFGGIYIPFMDDILNAARPAAIINFTMPPGNLTMTATIDGSGLPAMIAQVYRY